jgi:hypothetical protein
MPLILAMAALGVAIALLLVLLPLNWMLISLVLLVLGLAVMVLFHYAMWAYIEDEPPPDEPVIPPDLQGRRGPPHRNGDRRPGDPFYCK